MRGSCYKAEKFGSEDGTSEGYDVDFTSTSVSACCVDCKQPIFPLEEISLTGDGMIENVARIRSGSSWY